MFCCASRIAAKLNGGPPRNLTDVPPPPGAAYSAEAPPPPPSGGPVPPSIMNDSSLGTNPPCKTFDAPPSYPADKFKTITFD